jgi:hypothetical protein
MQLAQPRTHNLALNVPAELQTEQMQACCKACVEGTAAAAAAVNCSSTCQCQPAAHVARHIQVPGVVATCSRFD